MISERIHHRSVFPLMLGMRSLEAMNVSVTEMNDVMNTSEVSGCS